ncbi:hypothetical protein [Streptomyces physcomitrii]|uniref:Integral membrane protein n=1 Tax=Streptomyces physcomitrii TaxID=2724184 RepID=A0ABX1H206_9ACTN|nr:hypothetical protein [Streptomyces physcomitrii]NKI42407.1 hypothetical protein [Streptomyces physcomitrii]
MDIVRRVRLRAEPGVLFRTDRRGRERRYETAGGGLAAVRYFPPVEDEKGKEPLFPERWGTAVFEDAEGRPVLQIPLAQWFPEADRLGTLFLDEAEHLDRSGLSGLVRELGIPLHTEAKSLRDMPSAYQRHRGVYFSLRAVPLFCELLRGVSMLFFIAAFITVMVSDGPSETAYAVASGSLFVVPATLVLSSVVLRRRAPDRVPPGPGLLVRPIPEPSPAVTHRFLTVPFVKVLPEYVVLTDSTGRESWFAREGSAAVSQVTVVSDTEGEKLAVELQGPGEQVRAMLPWRWWFGGTGGERSWKSLVDALGLPVKHRVEEHETDMAHSLGVPLGADMRGRAPLAPKDARSATRSSEGAAARGEWVLLLFAAIFLPGLGLGPDDLVLFLAGVFSALTFLLILIPYATHQLRSRLRLDRPAAAHEPESTA